MSDLKRVLDAAPSNDFKHGLVSEEEAKKDKNAIYLDPAEEKIKIAEVDILADDVLAFMEYINQPSMVSMELKEPDAFKKHVEAKFAKNFEANRTVFNMLLDNDEKNTRKLSLKDQETHIRKYRSSNLTKLLSVFNVLAQVKKGNKDLTSEFERFKEARAAEYIYPQFGGKDKFAKKMAADNKKYNK